MDIMQQDKLDLVTMYKIIASGAYTKMLETLYFGNEQIFNNVKCWRCNANCCKSSVALPIDLIDKYFPSITEEDRVYFYKDLKTEIITPAPKGYVFIPTDNEKCIFLRNKKCTIYDERSIICKCYPYAAICKSECGFAELILRKVKADPDEVRELMMKEIEIAEKNDDFYFGNIKVDLDKMQENNVKDSEQASINSDCIDS